MTSKSARNAIMAFTASLALLPLSVQAQSPQQFLDKAIRGDTSEIMLGHLAEHRSANPAVRNFGHILVADHSQAWSQAAALARQLGLHPPDGPDQEAIQEVVTLHHMGGRDFDREFVNYMVRDHREDIADFRREAHQMNGPVSRLAREQLPTLYKHLHIAMSIAQAEARYTQR
jgi:putative membrane protein